MAESLSDGPVIVSTDITAAALAVLNASIVAVDTETTDVNYHTAQLVGVSLYPLGADIGFYLPVHSAVDSRGRYNSTAAGD